MSLPLTDITVSGSLAAADVTTLTTGAIDGTGAFDVLMQTTKLHLLEEYNAGRITGDEYTTVYLGAMQSVLAQAVQFLLNHQNEEKILAEIGLIRQKTVTELAQTDDTLPSGLGFNGTTAIEGLVQLQKDAVAQDILVKEQQVLNATAEVVLTGQKIITELAQTDNELTGAAAYGLNNDYLLVEGKVAAETDKSLAEAELLRQKVVSEVANVSEVLPATAYAHHDSTTVAGLISLQKDKTQAEVDLLDQKTVSELAQTADTVPVGEGIYTGVGNTVAGLVSKQKDLYSQQTAGFLRDAEQKLAKIMVDSYVARVAADDTTPTPPELDSDGVDEVILKAKTGISV